MRASRSLACREAVRLDAKHSRALKLLGSALYAEGDLEGAKQALQASLALKPGYADAHCDLGCVLCALAEEDQAKEAFQKAAHLNPHHIMVQTGWTLVPPYGNAALFHHLFNHGSYHPGRMGSG